MTVQTRSPLERGMAILDLLAASREATPLDRVTKLLEINKSSAFRLLESLEASGLVTRPADGSGYLLGSKALTLGEAFKRQFRVSGVCDEALVHLRDQTQESVGVFVMNYPERICIAAIESLAVVRRSLTVGQVMPLHSGAVGKVMLANLDESARNGYLASLKMPFKRGNTLVTREQINEEIKQALARRYAVSSEETVGGVWGVAVPIRTTELVAGMVVTGPMSRFPSTPKKIITLLQEAAQQVIEKL